MKTFIFLLIFVFFVQVSRSVVYEKSFYKETFSFPEQVFQKHILSYKPQNNLEVLYPGNFSSFWFAFLISLPFGFTLYFAGVGFLTVLWVYLATKDKHESKLAIWGFLVGVSLGILLKLLYLSSI